MVLEDRVAIVTGGAAGIGKAVATSLAEAGASVTIADIRHDLASEAAGELRDRGLSADAIAVDVSNAGQVQQMMASVVDAHGGVDILVNNAGIGQSSTLLETSEQEWDALMGVNLKRTFLCSRAADAKWSGVDEAAESSTPCLPQAPTHAWRRRFTAPPRPV